MKTILIGLSLLIISCQAQVKDDQEQAPPPAETTEITSPEPFHNIDVTQFSEMMSEEDVVILDVRRPDETELGMIDNAIALNVLEEENFRTGLGSLDKEKKYLVYCRSGRRSVTASNIMAELGFENIYNLEGGYNAWKEVHAKE